MIFKLLVKPLSCVLRVHLPYSSFITSNPSLLQWDVFCFQISWSGHWIVCLIFTSSNLKALFKSTYMECEAALLFSLPRWLLHVFSEVLVLPTWEEKADCSHCSGLLGLMAEDSDLMDRCLGIIPAGLSQPKSVWKRSNCSSSSWWLGREERIVCCSVWFCGMRSCWGL